MGFSLGGAMTLKLLGEPAEGLPIVAGVAVSAPLDLVVGADHLGTSAFGIYERAVVRTLRSDAMSPAPDGTSRLSPAERLAVAKVRSLPDFDDALTAPRHGWRDADEYYTVNSAAQFLPRIKVPTLVIHALDDPMIPAAPYLAVDWESLERTGGVRRAITTHGGHVGFHQRGNPMPWYAERAVGFLAHHVPKAGGS
jgi:predicted alpha/beta-fold hydrolase